MLPGPDVSVLVDPDQIEQILINLLQNAAEAEPARQGEVEVTWGRYPGGELAIEVLDRGPGPPSTDNLFVPFFTTKPDGAGIGLTLSREIVENHGGQLTLAPRGEGGGCRAVLTLPVDRER